MKKRIFGMLIAISMVFSILPVSVLAEAGSIVNGTSNINDSGAGSNTAPDEKCNCTVKCTEADSIVNCPICNAKNVNLTECQGGEAMQRTMETKEVTDIDTLKTAISTATGNTVIKLMNNIDVAFEIPQGNTYNYTIDLNSNKLTASGGDTITHNGQGELTIMDSNGGGTLSNDNGVSAIKNNGGEVTVTGGILSATESMSGFAIINTSGGTVTVTGGTLSASSAVIDNIGGEVTVTGGILSATGSGDAIKNNVDNKATVKELANCIILGNVTGAINMQGWSVYGTATLKTDTTIPSGKTLQIPNSATLKIEQDITLTNNGEINNQGTIFNGGTVNNQGTISNTGTVDNRNGKFIGNPVDGGIVHFAESDSKVTPTAAAFDKYTGSMEYTDVTLTQILNDNTLSNIKNCGTALINDTDYTVSGNTITIKGEYLGKQAAGITILTFAYSAGIAPTLTVTISDTTPPTTTYALTVTNGIGGGNFEPNTVVTISADAPATGKVFDTWTTTDGIIFAKAIDAVTTITMSAKAVTVTDKSTENWTK